MYSSNFKIIVHCIVCILCMCARTCRGSHGKLNLPNEPPSLNRDVHVTSLHFTFKFSFKYLCRDSQQIKILTFNKLSAWYFENCFNKNIGGV